MSLLGRHMFSGYCTHVLGHRAPGNHVQELHIYKHMIVSRYICRGMYHETEVRVAAYRREQSRQYNFVEVEQPCPCISVAHRATVVRKTARAGQRGLKNGLQKRAR